MAPQAATIRHPFSHPGVCHQCTERLVQGRHVIGGLEGLQISLCQNGPQLPVSLDDLLATHSMISSWALPSHCIQHVVQPCFMNIPVKQAAIVHRQAPTLKCPHQFQLRAQVSCCSDRHLRKLERGVLNLDCRRSGFDVCMNFIITLQAP